MHRPRAAAARGPPGAAGQRAHVQSPTRGPARRCRPRRTTSRAAEQLELVDRLAGADVAQLRRAVGGQHDQRHARLARLDTAGSRFAAAVPEVQVTATGSPLAFAIPSAMKPGARSSIVRHAREPLVGGERQRDRRVARPGRGHRVAHSAARQLVDEGLDRRKSVG